METPFHLFTSLKVASFFASRPSTSEDDSGTTYSEVSMMFLKARNNYIYFFFRHMFHISGYVWEASLYLLWSPFGWIPCFHVHQFSLSSSHICDANKVPGVVESYWCKCVGLGVMDPAKEEVCEGRSERRYLNTGEFVYICLMRWKTISGFISES